MTHTIRLLKGALRETFGHEWKAATPAEVAPAALAHLVQAHIRTHGGGALEVTRFLNATMRQAIDAIQASGMTADDVTEADLQAVFEEEVDRVLAAAGLPGLAEVRARLARGDDLSDQVPDLKRRLNDAIRLLEEADAKAARLQDQLDRATKTPARRKPATKPA